jgi:cell division protein ZapA (FtsZ GTPase activity inhibitor)
MTRAKAAGPKAPQGRRVTVEALGRSLELYSTAKPEELDSAIQVLEQSFQDMEDVARLTWGQAQTQSDSSAWLLLGALNLAHRVARLEREANQHTQDLEQTLSKLLSDVPDDTPPPPQGLFGAGEDT